MTNAVFVATRRDLANVESVMDKAFADDPTVLWVSKSPEVFADEHHRYVQLCAEPAFECGGVHATADFKGAAIWYPPEIGVSDEDYEEFKKKPRIFQIRLKVWASLLMPVTATDRRSRTGHLNSLLLILLPKVRV